MKIKNKKILITGGSGFIGKNMVKALSNNNELFITSHLTNNIRRKYSDNKKHIFLDLSKNIDIKKLPKDVDIIVHLAAITDKRFIINNKIETFNVNTKATNLLLDYGKNIGIESFIFASTAGVCGYNNEIIKEITKPKPFDYYTLTKYLSELLVNHYSEFFSTIVLRYFFPYGKNQQSNRFLPSILNNIKNKKEIVLYNGGQPRTNPIYIDDAIELTVRALSLKSSAIINIAGNDIYNIKQISQIIGGLLNIEPIFVEKDNKLIKNMIADTSLMKSLLVYEPKVPFKDGIKHCI